MGSQASGTASSEGAGSNATSAPSVERPLKVAIIVLNFQRYEETRGCLESLRSLRHPATVYWVDNASSENAAKALARDYPEATCLPLPHNEGYAGGMNHGIRAALADDATHCLLLNNDARVTPPLLDQLLALYGAQKDAGIVGPCVRALPPEPFVQSAGIDVNLYTGRVLLRGAGELPEALYPYPCKVDAVSGAALLVSRKVLEQVGLLEPSYFFYFEDIELCLRARRAGYATYVHPNAVVYHRGGATIGAAPEKVYYAVRNQLRLLCAHAVKLPVPLSWARSTFVIGLHTAQLLNEQRVPPLPGLLRLGMGVRDYLQGRGGAWGPAA